MKTYSHKYLCTNDHNTFTCNSLKQEATQMSFNGQMIKQTVVPRSTLAQHCAVEYYLAIKRNNLLICTATRMNLQIIMLSEKKIQSQKIILHDFIYITLLRWQNHRAEQQTGRCWDLTGEKRGVAVILRGYTRDLGDRTVLHLEQVDATQIYTPNNLHVSKYI